MRLRADLDDRENAGLAARARAASAVATRPGASLAGTGAGGFEERGESFAQLLGSDGRVRDRAAGPRGAALTPAELRRAATATLRIERRVPAIDGTARMLARPLSVGGAPMVLVVGQSLDDREEALAGVVRSFAVGAPAAVALASMIGYLLSAAGMRPVEAIRRRAREVSFSRTGEQLPLPRAHDEVRRLGETLNEMLERLRRSFERERRFVADASHELRTPIAVVKTELEGALRSGALEAQVREALVAAVEECDHLTQLADDLLIIARAAEGELPVRPEGMPARALLDGVRDRFADRAAQQGRAVRVEAEAGLNVSVDPLRARQALGNLVDNALRHGDGEIALGAYAAGGGVMLEVADCGPGFAPEIAGRAFDRFARDRRARGSDGSGLGMAIVLAIAEAHGGAATIVPGPGACVRVWLPDAGGGPVTQPPQARLS